MSILIVDSSKDFRETLIRYLELANIFDDIFEADTARLAKKIMKIRAIDIILFDIQLIGDSGLELVSLSKEMPYKPILVICSNYKYPQYKSIFENMSINYFFDKYSELYKLKMFIKQLAADKQRFLFQSLSAQNNN